MNKNSKLWIVLKGIIAENPVLVLVLGTCPVLAVSTSVVSAISMGIAATLVLICSNTLISLLRKIIPDTVRIPCYIVVIAGFVTIIQMLLQAFLPDIYIRLVSYDSRSYYDRCKRIYFVGLKIYSKGIKGAKARASCRCPSIP